jgi:hypothetical protein
VALGQALPADEHLAVDALLRQLDFYGGELRASDIELGRVALGLRRREDPDWTVCLVNGVRFWLVKAQGFF